MAELVTTVPPRPGCGVTGMTKLLVPPDATRPAGTVQVTTWPDAAQSGGSVPKVRPAGSESVIVETAGVAAVPLFVSVSV